MNKKDRLSHVYPRHQIYEATRVFSVQENLPILHVRQPERLAPRTDPHGQHSGVRLLPLIFSVETHSRRWFGRILGGSGSSAVTVSRRSDLLMSFVEILDE